MTVGRNVNKRDDNVKRRQTTVGRNVNQRDDNVKRRRMTVGRNVNKRDDNVKRRQTTVGCNVNKRDDNVKRRQMTVGRNVNKRDDSWAQRWCDVSTSPTTATGDTANRNDSDVTTYNRQTTTDDTAIYGISDAHVNEVHSQSTIDIHGCI